MERERIVMEEIADFPADLRTPKNTSERWSLKSTLFVIGLPLLTTIAGVAIGLEISELLHLNGSSKVGVVAFSGWVSAVAGLVAVTPRLLEKHT